MKKNLVIEAACFLFILLFTYAAVTKLMEFQKFKVQIGQSPMFTPYRNLIAWLVPGLEVVTGISLAFQKTRFLGLYSSFALMSLFTVYIITVTTFSDHVPCSCGGILEKMGWMEHLFFNIFFVALAAVAVMLYATTHVHSPPTPQGNSIAMDQEMPKT